MDDEVRLVTADVVAHVLGVSAERVHQLAREGLLPCVRLGRSVRFDERRLDAWLDQGGQALAGGWKRRS